MSDNIEYCYLTGQRVLLNRTEIGTVVAPENNGFAAHDYIWVMSPSKGCASAYAKHNIQPLPNGQL